MTSDRYPVGCLSIWEPIHLGIDEAGQPVWIEMIERNLLLGGEPGGGKSNAINLIVGGWLLAEGGTPRRVKAAYLTDEHIENLAVHVACCRGGGAAA